jgi:acylpyruvate hydrolase
MTLKIGDLIFTGTPKGVSQIEVGDILEGFIEQEKVLTTRIK